MDWKCFELFVASSRETAFWCHAGEAIGSRALDEVEFEDKDAKGLVGGEDGKGS